MKTQKHDQCETDILTLSLTLPFLHWKASDKVTFPYKSTTGSPLPTAHKFPTSLWTYTMFCIN